MNQYVIRWWKNDKTVRELSVYAETPMKAIGLHSNDEGWPDAREWELHPGERCAWVGHPDDPTELIEADLVSDWDE